MVAAAFFTGEGHRVSCLRLLIEMWCMLDTVYRSQERGLNSRMHHVAAHSAPGEPLRLMFCTPLAIYVEE